MKCEYTEGDFIVGRFGAALKQAGKDHRRRRTWHERGHLNAGQVRVPAMALVDHPGATPAVWITSEHAEGHSQVHSGRWPSWMGVHHPGRGEEVGWVTKTMMKPSAVSNGLQVALS